MYHLVCPLKYRKNVITKEIGETLKEICKGITERYEINFIEIGYESDHVHFLVQSVPESSVTVIVRTIKSITAKKVFQMHPEIKIILWGGSFWTSGYYANTVGQYASEDVIGKYVESLGKQQEYRKIYSGKLSLF